MYEGLFGVSKAQNHDVQFSEGPVYQVISKTM